MSKETHAFEAEVSQVLKLVINSLYSNKEVFLRELISNASDALDKRRFRAIQEPEVLSEGEELKIQILPNREQKTLTISDNGIGMTHDELAKSLGTVAWSGSRAFIDALSASQDARQKDLQLIGQFGVGFYSAYLVADRVEVVSRAAGTVEAYRWESTGQDKYTLERAEREAVGTSVILHLKEDQGEYFDDYRLRRLVERYSDYIPHPIELPEKSEKPDEPVTLTAVNRASALWQRSPKDLTEEQYTEFYKHLSHDWEPPLARRHFHIEGTQMFAGLLFVPKRPPFDLFEPELRHGVRLHVKRVFVMDNCEELVPRWLRFVKGVIDSEDLPLNVSREVLQDSKAVKIIKKQVISQSLDALEELATEKPDEYRDFWKGFGAVLKEGLHFDPEYQDRIAKLLRFESSSREGFVSLDEYIEKMPVDQKEIYYATGASRELVKNSPHLEQLRKRGFEVLVMFEPIDPFVMQNLTEYQEKKLVSAMAADLSLDAASDSADAAKNADTPETSRPLLEHFKQALSDQVGEVRPSKRLADSPACLVVPDGGLAPHIERMLRARNETLPVTKRILEVNLEHPLIQKIGSLCATEAGANAASDWMKLVYDQALLAEGSPIDDPGSFAKRMTKLMTIAAESELAHGA
jgi:molecular chaperone HtpG